MSVYEEQIAKMYEQDNCIDAFDFDDDVIEVKPVVASQNNQQTRKHNQREQDLGSYKATKKEKTPSKQQKKENNNSQPKTTHRQADLIDIQLNAVKKQKNRELDAELQGLSVEKKKEENNRPVPKVPEGREMSNGIYFHPQLIPKIRAALKERGIDAVPLKQPNSLPNLYLLQNPVRSYSQLFGGLCGFLVTGYRNNGRTERIIISPIDAPTYHNNDTNIHLDVSDVLSKIGQKMKGKSERFSFSLILSADESMAGDNNTQEILIEKPFSIDGIFGGIYQQNGKPMLFIRNQLPLLIRENYPFFEELKNRTYPEDNVQAFFRRITRDMTEARDREVFIKEMKAFASNLPLEEAEIVLGDINMYVEH